MVRGPPNRGFATHYAKQPLHRMPSLGLLHNLSLWDFQRNVALGHLRLRWLERSGDDAAQVLHTAVLLVLLVQVADAAAPALQEGAHGVVLARLGSIPHDLEWFQTAQSQDAGDRFTEGWIAELLVDLCHGARAAAVVEAAKWALCLEEAGVPLSLLELVHSCTESTLMR